MKKQRRLGRRVLTLLLCSAMCLTQVQLSKAETQSEGVHKLAYDTGANSGVINQYESDASGRLVNVEKGTSRYYTEYITYSKTVYISNSNKNQLIPIEIKAPYTNIDYLTYNDSKGVDEDGYRWLSDCKVYLMNSAGKIINENIINDEDSPSYKTYLNLTPGKYNINVVQGLEVYWVGDDAYQRLVEGNQTVVYRMFRVVDRQAPASTDSTNNLKDNTSGTLSNIADKNTVITSKAKKSIKVTKLKVKKNAKKITGKTNKKALVTVTANGRKYKIKANKKGQFTVRLQKKLKKNIKVKIKVTLKGYKTYNKSVKVK